MSFVSFTPKARIEKQHQLILTLEEKCSACDLFKGKVADQEYLYTVTNRHYKEPAVLAFAEFNDFHTYAVYAPEDMPKEHFSIFEFFLDEVKKCAEPEEKIVVFSQKIYDAIMARNTYNPFPVQLHILS